MIKHLDNTANTETLDESFGNISGFDNTIGTNAGNLAGLNDGRNLSIAQPSISPAALIGQSVVYQTAYTAAYNSSFYAARAAMNNTASNPNDITNGANAGSYAGQSDGINLSIAQPYVSPNALAGQSLAYQNAYTNAYNNSFYAARNNVSNSPQQSNVDTINGENAGSMAGSTDGRILAISQPSVSQIALQGQSAAYQNAYVTAYNNSFSAARNQVILSQQSQQSSQSQQREQGQYQPRPPKKIDNKKEVVPVVDNKIMGLAPAAFYAGADLIGLIVIGLIFKNR